MTVLLMMIVMVINMAVGLPVLYRFGAEGAGAVVFTLLAGSVGVGLAILYIVTKYGGMHTADLPLPLVLLGIALAAGLLYLSFRLSVAFYRRKQYSA